MQSRDHLRECARELDILENESDWPTVEKDLKDYFYRLEEKSNKSDNTETKAAVSEIKNQVDKVIKEKDVKTAKELISLMATMNLKLSEEEHGVSYWIGCIYHYDKEFDSQEWKDRSKARMIIDQGKQEAASNPTIDRMRNICIQLFRLLPGNEKGNAGPDDILGE
jgi:molecular chaperone DnaK